MHKILIAEDDRDIVKVLELYLNNNGFETVVASDGEKAVEIIENDDISLALLDIMMPKKDGYAVAEYIRENRSEERRVGKECRIGCRSRWSPYH